MVCPVAPTSVVAPFDGSTVQSLFAYAETSQSVPSQPNAHAEIERIVALRIALAVEAERADDVAPPSAGSMRANAFMPPATA